MHTYIVQENGEKFILMVKNDFFLPSFPTDLISLSGDICFYQFLCPSRDSVCLHQYIQKGTTIKFVNFPPCKHSVESLQTYLSEPVHIHRLICYMCI